MVALSVLLVSIAAYCIFNGYSYFASRFFSQGLLISIPVIAFDFVVLGLIHEIVSMTPNCKYSTLRRWSFEITAIFVIHYLIITSLWLFVTMPNVICLFLLSMGIMTVSDILAHYYLKLKKERKSIRSTTG